MQDDHVFGHAIGATALHLPKYNFITGCTDLSIDGSMDDDKRRWRSRPLAVKTAKKERSRSPDSFIIFFKGFQSKEMVL